MLTVSESYQNYQNGAVFNQLTDVGRAGGCVLGVSVNLLMCDSDGGLYSVHTTV
jgi:hypothetical protein